MKIGFIVDGQSEHSALPHLLRRIKTKNEFITIPLRAGLQPYGSAEKAAREVMPSIMILKRRGAHRIIILIDREKQPDCGPGVAQRIAAALQARCQTAGVRVDLAVVIKDRQFENWLIADPDAFLRLKARFEFKSDLKRVVLNRADTCDAIGLIKSAVIGDAYDKVRDAERILQEADPLRMAQNSRSFRRFLRVVGHPKYKKQSKVAVQ